MVFVDRIVTGAVSSRDIPKDKAAEPTANETIETEEKPKRKRRNAD